MARPRSDIAPRVVEAARKRFLLEGVDGASLRAIAEDAGTSIGMVYYYFPTKDDLFLAIVEEIYAALLHELEELVTGEVPFEERLRRVSARLGRMSDAELQVVQLIVREALVSSARLDRLVERFMRGHVPLVFGAIASALQEGKLDLELPPSVLLSATFAVTVFPQILRRAVGARAPMLAGLPPSEELAPMLVDVLMHGIRKGEPGARTARLAAKASDAPAKKPKRR